MMVESRKSFSMLPTWNDDFMSSIFPKVVIEIKESMKNKEGIYMGDVARKVGEFLISIFHEYLINIKEIHLGDIVKKARD
jgi:hypothetical protein